MSSARGSALLQVLLVAVVAGLICASLMSSRMQPALTAANAVTRTQNDAVEQAALNRVNQAWMQYGSCSSNPATGVACAGAQTGCACTCTVTGLAKVVSVPKGGACAITATAD